MLLTVVCLLLLAALGGLWLVWRHRGGTAPAPAAATRAPRVPLPAAPAQPAAPPAPRPGAPAHAPAPATAAWAPTALPPATGLPAVPPESVGSFDWQLAEALAADRRQQLLAAVGRIRRPPAALNQMLSPQFLDRASSQALSELINGEAQIAAKVLATVNAPFYGLSKPVTGIGQAVTFLGLNTVRAICLRDLLDASFPARQPALKQAMRELWDASALASELCNRLSSKLGLADGGALMAQVLLSFLGHLATAALLAERPGAAVPPGTAPLLDRCRAAQDALGLVPAETGGLLLQAWGLPAAIVDSVRAIDRMVVSPAGELPAAEASRLALAHLCARLGEQLAAGVGATGAGAGAGAGGLVGLAAGLLEAEDSFHLRAHLAAPSLARLGEHLQAPDLVQAVTTLQQGLRAAR
jgi:HD-like signal output (HDOD) protein